MKNYLFGLSCLIASAAVMWAQAPEGAPASAAPTKGAVPNKIGVIQIQLALTGTKEGQCAAAEFQKKQAPKEAEFEKRQNDIRDIQEKLSRGGNTLSATVQANYKGEIDQKTKALNRDMEDAQAEMDTEQRKIVDDLGQKLLQVVGKFAQANGYSLILDVSNPNTPVFWASDAVDVTADVISLYDKSQPTAPAGAKPAPAKPATAAPKPPASAPAKKQ